MSRSSSISTSEAAAAPPTGYFAAAALATLVLVAATAAVIWWIDPFNRLGRNWLGLYSASERDAKPGMIADGTWRGVILGSSKTTYIDPHALRCPGFFNASFPGAVPEEMLDFLRTRAVGPRAALIGLDFYMFNERAFPWRPDGLDAAPLAEYLLSGRVGLVALRDLRAALRGEQPRLGAAGEREAAGQLARHAAMAAPDPAETLAGLEANHFAAVDYSERRLAVLVALRELLEARGMRYVVFINPLSRPVLELLERLPAHAEFLRFRRDVRRIFPDLVDLSESRWSAPELYFRFDPYHYLPAVGAAFVNEMLPRVCPPAG